MHSHLDAPERIVVQYFDVWTLYAKYTWRELVSPSGDIALKGAHRLHSCRPRVNPWLEAFGALLPPRRRRVRGRDVL
jgi:hypothetical protein